MTLSEEKRNMIREAFTGESKGHIGHIGKHRVKVPSFAEKCIVHFSTHCVHFVGFVIISIIPIALWEKGPEMWEHVTHL